MTLSLLPQLREERLKYGTIMNNDECVNLLNSVCYHNPGWGLNVKDFGVHGVRYDGIPCSFDTIIHQDSFHIFDVLVGAGAESAPTWNDLGLHTQSNRPYLEPITPREPAPPVILTTKLGASLFSLVDLYTNERGRADETLRVLHDELGASFVRVMWRKGTGAAGDYWLNSPYYSCVRSSLNDLPVSLMIEVMAYVRSFGMRIAHCVFADSLGMTLAAQDAFREGFIQAALAVPEVHEYVEVFNEPYTYGGGHGGIISDLQHHARRLRSAFGPAMLISLGTPISAHMGGDIETEVRDMYGSCPEANLITVHFDRSTNSPQLAPDLGPYAPIRRSNGEPIGPDSSGNSTSDPTALTANYLYTQAKGYEWYVFHADQLIRPRGSDVWDIPGWPAIADALSEASGAITVNLSTDILGPGDELSPDQFIQSANERFTLIYQGDGNLVIYDNTTNDATWHTGTHGTVPNAVAMQGDGNFVVYSADGPEWASDTFAHGSTLIMQNDGNLVIYTPEGEPVWASGTAI